MINFKRLFASLLFVTTLLSSAQVYTPQNTIISMDLDDVVITRQKGMKWKVFKQTFSLNPIKFVRRLRALLKLKNKTDHGLINQVMNNINQKSKSDLGAAARIIHTIINDSQPIPGTVKILQHLKQKGYTIHFGTNKERLAYDGIARRLGSSFTSLANHVVVAEQPTPEYVKRQYQNLLHRNYVPTYLKNLLRQKLNIKETNTIHHAPVAKPRFGYAHKQREIANKYWNGTETPYIVFFDDKKENIASVNNNADKKMIGRQFVNPIQFAQELVKLGILSLDKDAALLQSIGYTRGAQQNNVLAKSSSPIFVPAQLKRNSVVQQNGKTVKRCGKCKKCKKLQKRLRKRQRKLAKRRRKHR